MLNRSLNISKDAVGLNKMEPAIEFLCIDVDGEQLDGISIWNCAFPGFQRRSDTPAHSVDWVLRLMNDIYRS